nr:uncharacterized protein LOC108389730 isoform X4 [Manis javanica]XP_036850317.1 uncharacterized protein LOC108389730 isoform X4 [Manis javanica]
MIDECPSGFAGPSLRHDTSRVQLLFPACGVLGTLLPSGPKDLHLCSTEPDVLCGFRSAPSLPSNPGHPSKAPVHGQLLCVLVARCPQDRKGTSVADGCSVPRQRALLTMVDKGYRMVQHKFKKEQSDSCLEKDTGAESDETVGPGEELFPWSTVVWKQMILLLTCCQKAGGTPRYVTAPASLPSHHPVTRAFYPHISTRHITARQRIER